MASHRCDNDPAARTGRLERVLAEAEQLAGEARALLLDRQTFHLEVQEVVAELLAEEAAREAYSSSSPSESPSSSPPKK